MLIVRSELRKADGSPRERLPWPRGGANVVNGTRPSKRDAEWNGQSTQGTGPILGKIKVNALDSGKVKHSLALSRILFSFDPASQARFSRSLIRQCAQCLAQPCEANPLSYGDTPPMDWESISSFFQSGSLIRAVFQILNPHPFWDWDWNRDRKPGPS